MKFKTDIPNYSARENKPSKEKNILLIFIKSLIHIDTKLLKSNKKCIKS